MSGFERLKAGIVAVGVLFAFSSGARAASDAPRDPDKTLSPYFFVEGGDPKLDQLPLEDTHVDVAVAGVIADVTVTQRYKNDGKRPISAKYVFPASTRAAVHGMRMVIGNRAYEAKIKEREQAKKEYEAHKEAGKNAALLEQDRPNVFTMSVANVMPGDHIDVTLRYTELLVPADGTYEFVYPTVVGPRYSNEPALRAPSADKFVASPYLAEGKAPTSTFELAGTLSEGIPVRKIASPSHQIGETWENANFAKFSLDGSEKNGGNRDFILNYALAGDAIQSGLSLFDGGTEKFFSVVVEPPARVRPEQIPPREYVFVLDVSGSMEGFPLDTAKRVLRELAGTLRPVDKFNVLLFSGASYLIAPKSMSASPENVAAALKAIDKERGGGGTELLPALQTALGLPQETKMSRTFVVMTDGYIEADKGAIDLVRSHLGDANVFSFGIGTSVNRYLIEGIAKAGQGEPFVVTDPSEAPKAAARFRDYIGAPVLTQVKAKYDGFDAYDVDPVAIPDVFAARPVIVFGKYRGAAKGTITVSGIGGTGPYEQRFDVSQTVPRPENRALTFLWARSRIGNLSDFGFGEPTDADKAGITALGLKYNLLTAYTSFIAVSEVVRTSTPGMDVAQPLPLPEGVSADAVGTPMQGADEPELWLLALAALTLFALTSLTRPRRVELAQ
jgi:Ca-activated chloride channel family protein